MGRVVMTLFLTSEAEMSHPKQGRKKTLYKQNNSKQCRALHQIRAQRIVVFKKRIGFTQLTF